MTSRLTDEEYARHAAKHSLHPKGEPPRPERIESLKAYGVTDEKSLGDHALKVMSDPDTKCFRGHEGREVYGNDQLNTIVRTNEKNPEQSTVHHNDDTQLSATQRVEKSAKAEGARNNTSYQIRTGGSQALEQDRAAQSISATGDKPEPPESTKPGASQAASSPQKEPEPSLAPKQVENPYRRSKPQEQQQEQDQPKPDNPYRRTPPDGSGRKH